MVYYPQKPTDWTEGLASVYDRQSRQLQEHHDNLRARDAREVEVQQQESFVRTMAKIAEFSSAASSLYNAAKKGKEVKDEKQTTEVKNWMTSHPSTSDKLTEIIKDNDLKKKDVWKWFNRPEQKELKLEWEANGEYEKLRELRKIYGTNNIILRQALAVRHGQSLQNSPEWDDYKYNKYGENLDSISSAELMQTKADFYSEEVMKLGVTKEFATANYASEINKQATVTKNLQQAKQLTLRNKEQVQLVRTLFPIAATSNNTAELGEIFVTEATNRETQFKPIIENGEVVKTSLQQAVDSVYQDLWTLNEEGYIPDISILGDYKFEHPAGTKNEEGEKVADIFTALFDKKGDKYNSLIAANNRGKTKLLSAATTIDTVRLGELRQAALQGKDVSRELQILKNRGLLNEKQIKAVSDIDIRNQTKETYDEGKQEWDTIKIDGHFMTKNSLDNAKLIKNGALNDEIIKEQKKLQKSYDANGFDTYGERHDGHTSKIKTNAGDRSPFPGANIGGFDERLADELTNLEAQMYYALWQKDSTSREIGDRVVIQMAALKEQNGFGKKIGEDGAGIWSTDETGELVNYKRSKIGALAIKDNGDNWFKGHMTKWNNIKTTDTPEISMVDNFLNTPGSVLTKDKVLEIIKSKELTAEFAYKVDLIPGKDETQVLTQITEALLNSDDKTIKEFVKKNNLKNLWEDLITPIKSGEEVVTPLSELIETQTFITDLVDKSGNLDFAGIHKRGLSNASPKQKVRYYNYLQMNSDIQAEKESDAKLAKDAELKRAIEYQKQRKKAKEEEDKQTAKAAEILQKNIEGLWTP